MQVSPLLPPQMPQSHTLTSSALPLGFPAAELMRVVLLHGGLAEIGGNKNNLNRAAPLFSEGAQRWCEATAERAPLAGEI